MKPHSRYQKQTPETERRLVASCPIGLDKEPSHSATHVMTLFYESEVGAWVDTHASYLFWELHDSHEYNTLLVNIYADFNQMDAMAFELKFGHTKYNSIF